MQYITHRFKFIACLLFVVCCGLVLLPGSVIAAVEATGMGAITVSKAQAREDALNDAQRNAVEQVLGSMLTSETLVENFVLVEDKILTRVSGYVKKHTVLSERYSAEDCTIVIRAEVEEMALADDVAALAGLLPRMNYPTLAISLKEQSLNAQSGQVDVDLSAARQALMQVLHSKGFNLVDLDALQNERNRQAGLTAAFGDSKQQAQEAASHQAQLLITGTAIVQDNGASPYNERLHAYGATITANIHESVTGRILASANAQATAPQFSFALGSQKALGLAATDLANQLSDQVVQVWLDSCYNEHKVVVVVENAGFSDVQNLLTSISALSGVTTAQQKSFVRGRAELIVGWKNCNVMRMAGVMHNLSVGAKHLEILEVQGNTLRTKLQ
ncbi:MAG: hypothetical protein U9R29_10465 [Thermodesulfobacteriota bacterium]|nr:hypothetical protein [Thermodesulfobacteriota bacterium]